MGLFRIVIIALALVGALAPMPPDVVERWFSTGVYPAIQHALTPLTNRVPFAIFDALVAAAIALVALILKRGVQAAWRTRRVGPLVGMTVRLITTGAVAYVVFLSLWGLNYRRTPMSQRLLVAASAPSSDAVVSLGIRAAGRLNMLYRDAHREGWLGGASRNRALTEAFRAVQRDLSDAAPAEPGRIKFTLLGRYFRWTGVDGMINPFGLEVLASPDLLPFEEPFVAAHEWAHLAGYADEAEANFVGWLTCVRADVPERYAGWLFLYLQVSGEVGTRERERMAAALATGPRGDVQAIIDRLRRGQWPVLRNAGWTVYDQYLKANRVEEGIRSYGLVTTLVLQTKFTDEWSPARRPAAISNPSERRD